MHTVVRAENKTMHVKIPGPEEIVMRVDCMRHPAGGCCNHPPHQKHRETLKLQVPEHQDQIQRQSPRVCICKGLCRKALSRLRNWCTASQHGCWKVPGTGEPGV